MDLYILIAVGILNIFLGLSVLRTNRHAATNVLFFLFIGITIAWSTTNHIATIYLKALDTVHSIFWVRMTMLFAVSQAISFFFLVHTFPKPKMVLRKKYFFGLIFFGLVTMMVALSPFLFPSVTIQDGKAITNPGPGMALFLPVAGGAVIAGIIKLLKKYHKAFGLEKIQLRYLFLGLSLMFLFILTFNFAFVVFLKNLSFVTFAPLFTLPFLVSIFYAITRHRLLDIRLVILRTITYSLIVLLISATVVGLTLLLPQALGVSLTTRTIIAILASIFIVLILEPLKRTIANATDKLFFKAKVDYIKLQAELGEIINREIDLDVLLNSLAHQLENDLKIKNASIYIAGVAGGAFFKRKGRLDRQGKKLSSETLEQFSPEETQDLDNKLAHNNPLIEYLRKEQQVIVLEALERKIEDTQYEATRQELESSKAELDKLDAAVVAPINIADNLNAVLVLGPKQSGDPFGSEDLQLLSLLGPQLASALDKSRLYDEVKQFSERLKKEIAIATEDVRRTNLQLQEHNRFLSALQNVTNLITRTLDFKKVTQSIADSIHSELGYLGGILLFLGKDRHKIFPDAVTQSTLTPQVLKLLPKPLTELYGDFRKDESRSVKAIKLREVQIGTDLDEFLSPALTPDVCEKIQKLLKIKTVVAVPIYSEEGIVGAIVFLLDRQPDTLKETDLSMMKALCNQTGIVYRNIELYRQLQTSNKDLAEANKHLHQLDQAKSEFVSIASHQLRTPMAGIMGYLSMILQNDFGKVNKEQKGVLQKLLQASQRMIQLINLFLDVTKIESGRLVLDRRLVKIEEVVGRSIEVLKKMADEKGLALKYIRPKKPLPPVMADEKIFDVISNLIDNSIKYTEKGTITVTASGDSRQIKVSVHDTGRGINAEEVKGLFAKFVRGSGMAQVNPDGSGLGLYVARRITEAHGGKIWVESKGLGKGSTFIFTLPVKAASVVKK